MKRSCFTVILSSILLVSGFCCGEEAKLAGPLHLPNTNIAMKNPGFWIARHPSPDRAILNAGGIEAFNKNIKELPGLVMDPAEAGPVYPGDQLRSLIENDLNGLAGQVLYDERGKRVTKEAMGRIRSNTAIGLIYKRCVVTYGVVWNYTDQRFVPSGDIMTSEAGDTDFDRLQQSSLDIGTPLAILHESLDHKWVYARSRGSWGWVEKASVAFCGADALKNFEGARPFIIVTSPKADIYLDGGLTAYYGTVRMGARFPCYEKVERGVVMMRVPRRDDSGKLVEMTGFMKRNDVNFGYLTYTPRSIIEQAFKLLNAPYGWGGSGQEQDCSGLLQEVFATVGIMLPRNSAEQGEIGYLLGEFSEKTPEGVKFDTIARDAVGGITTLKLDGHIMLYLGIYGLKPYAIHATYGYGEKTPSGGVDRVLNRVVVSDLSLGSGSKKGSLLERLLTIRLMADQDVKGR